MQNALNAMDTPSGDGINTYVVSKAIRQNGMTVALSEWGEMSCLPAIPSSPIPAIAK